MFLRSGTEFKLKMDCSKLRGYVTFYEVFGTLKSIEVLTLMTLFILIIKRRFDDEDNFMALKISFGICLFFLCALVLLSISLTLTKLMNHLTFGIFQLVVTSLMIILETFYMWCKDLFPLGYGSIVFYTTIFLFCTLLNIESYLFLYRFKLEEETPPVETTVTFVRTNEENLPLMEMNNAGDQQDEPEREFSNLQGPSKCFIESETQTEGSLADSQSDKNGTKDPLSNPNLEGETVAASSGLSKSLRNVSTEGKKSIEQTFKSVQNLSSDQKMNLPTKDYQSQSLTKLTLRELSDSSPDLESESHSRSVCSAEGTSADVKGTVEG